MLDCTRIRLSKIEAGVDEKEVYILHVTLEFAGHILASLLF